MDTFDKKVNAINKIFGDKYNLPIGTEFSCAKWHLNSNSNDIAYFKVVSDINIHGVLVAECIGVSRFPIGKLVKDSWVGKRKRIAAHRVDIFLNGR